MIKPDNRDYTRDDGLYNRTMIRLKYMGAHSEREAIISLSKECEYYREKIRVLEEHDKNVDWEKGLRFLLNYMPDEFKNKLYSLNIEPNGSVEFWFNARE